MLHCFNIKVKNPAFTQQKNITNTRLNIDENDSGSFWPTYSLRPLLKCNE